MSFHAARAVVALALCAAALVAGDYTLPATIRPCNRDAHDFASCLRLAIQKAWPTFVAGLSDFGIPPLDPFSISTFSYQYEGGAFSLNLTTSDVQLYGLSKAQFLSVKPESTPDSLRLEVDVEFAKLLFEGNYKASGGLGEGFQVNGKGPFNVSMEDVRITWDIIGHIADDRWVVDHFKISPSVGNMRIWFDNLFNGNGDLNHAALIFINEYWPLIYRRIVPKLTESADEYLTEFSNRFFSKIPYSTLFPSSE